MEEKNIQNEVKDVEQNVNNMEKSGKKKTIVLISVLLVLILAIGICGGYFLSKNTGLFNKNETQSNNTNSNGSQREHNSNIENDSNEVINVVSRENNSKQMIIEGKDKNNNIVWTYTTPLENVPVEPENRGQKLIETRKGKVYLCDWGKLYILDEQTGDVLAKNIECNIGAAAVYTFDENDNLYTVSYLSFLNKFDTNAKLIKSTEEVWNKGFAWPKGMTLNGDNIVIDYGEEGVITVNKETLEITDTKKNANVTTQQSSKDTNDYSVFSSFKGCTYKNEDFKNKNEENTYSCEMKFDNTGKPTLNITSVSDVHNEVVFVTKNITNIKQDIAAGTTYVTFDFMAWTPGGDTTGNATVSYSNVLEDYTMTVSTRVNYQNDIAEFNNINVKAVNQTAVESFKLPEFANRVYEGKDDLTGLWYKLEFDENGKPTITIISSEGENKQIVDKYTRFTDVSIDNAAGSAYVTFSYRLLNETGDKVEGILKYSNVTENNSIYIELNTANNKEIALVKVK